jgi:DNA-binding PadR family transcriptional regulator
MNATRLLVLGAVRIMQPVHGYDVRRELLTWRLEDHANVKPGSIYGAIRTLEKDGCVAVHSRESAESRPERTTYVLTGEGEKEFEILLRESWWSPQRRDEALIPALCLMLFLPREELIRALQARIGHLESELDAMGEIFDLLTARARADLEWTRALQKRVRDGAYQFTGDDGFRSSGPARESLVKLD